MEDYPESWYEAQRTNPTSPTIAKLIEIIDSLKQQLTYLKETDGSGLAR